MTTFNLEYWENLQPYGLPDSQKSVQLLAALNHLVEWHSQNCVEYNRILRVVDNSTRPYQTIEEVPFIPVRLFKELDLVSVNREDIYKTMHSSGTTGQKTSKIALDRETARLQTRVLSEIMKATLGHRRLPMLVIDSADTISNRNAFSARAAGIRGFMMFGSDLTFALDQKMMPDWDVISAFVDRHMGERALIFGFTFMIWQHLLSELARLDKTINFGDSILLHGGGWKQLNRIAVSNDSFKRTAKDFLGIDRVVNYYGMVEQTGSLFMECEYGYLHAPGFSDIVVRDPFTLEPVPIGGSGLIQLLSMTPISYPGHSILTEDVGTYHGIDDCRCGRLGRYFTVEGRIAKAEPRGCSDTYESIS
ncbi:MAG: hypothetical protein RL594_794 [Bacteroidota bacterium]